MNQPSALERLQWATMAKGAADREHTAAVEAALDVGLSERVVAAAAGVSGPAIHSRKQRRKAA